MVTHARGGSAGWAGTEDDSWELCFPRKCLPSSRVRADGDSLPHLSSPLPVPLRVLVPGWCFLVTAAAVSMCVTGPEPPVAGGPPARPPPLPPGCGTSACPLAGLRVSCLSPTRGGARLVASQWCSAPRSSADPLGCPPLPARLEPEVVVQRKAGHPIASVGLAVLRILPPLPPRFSRLLVKPVR